MGNHMFLRTVMSATLAFVLGVAPTIAIIQATTVAAASDASSSSGIFITELQTRSVDDANEEFIELHNTTTEAIDLSDWRLEYMPATGTSWTSKIRGDQSVDPIYFIEPGEFYVLATENFSDQHGDVVVHQTLSSGSAEGGGHIRLLEPTSANDDIFDEVDKLAWGSANDTPQNTAPAIAPGQSQSIYRCFIGDELQVSHDNSIDFHVSEFPHPGYGYDCPVSDSDDSDEVHTDDPNEGEQKDSEDIGEDDDANEGDSSENHQDDSNDDAADDDGDKEADLPDDEDNKNPYNENEQTEEAAVCSESIVLSELLPNPEGPRSEFPREQHAFIELHNTSNETTSLYGCHLQTSASTTTVFSFEPSAVLEPHEYKAFYPEETAVFLPVSPSGTVYLLSGEGNVDDYEELQSVTYEAGMPEAASYSWLGEDEWSVTYAITPDAKNELLELRPCSDPNQERSPETNRCRNTVTAASTADLIPCGPGQERNPETNRCRLIDRPERELVPCGPGQERNPETNRCRSINAGQRQLVPCGPGQERNPDTNRCRNIESTASSLVPCGPGQERNPDTNRCRTVAQPNSEVMGVEDIKVAMEQDASHLMLSGLFFGAALSYGAWEWRREMRRLWQRVSRRLSRPR